MCKKLVCSSVVTVSQPLYLGFNVLFATINTAALHGIQAVLKFSV